jgi:hypothetical protein
MAHSKANTPSFLVLATVCYFLPLIIALPIKGLPPNPIENVTIFVACWMLFGLPLFWYSYQRSS